jgi:hypothetical protein
MLEVREGEAASARDDRGAPDDRGLALALNALSDARRAALAETLSVFADQLERHRNPLVEDLDEDARPAVERLVRDDLPVLTAAAALSDGRWASADGRMVVRATTSCSPGARCLPLAGAHPATDRAQARARFLAWPLAYGVMIRPPAATQGALVEALRAPKEESRIALVVSDADLHGVRPSDSLALLAGSAARVARLAPDDMPMKELFQRLASTGAVDDLRWLALPAGALLVVPRLGALAVIDAFVAEVRERAAAVTPAVEWISAPAR